MQWFHTLKSSVCSATMHQHSGRDKGSSALSVSVGLHFLPHRLNGQDHLLILRAGLQPKSLHIRSAQHCPALPRAPRPRTCSPPGAAAQRESRHMQRSRPRLHTSGRRASDACSATAWEQRSSSLCQVRPGSNSRESSDRGRASTNCLTSSSRSGEA